MTAHNPEVSKVPLVALAAFVSGAAVMVLEILGTRVIGPVFGASLYVWSALIAVTLCSLAIGYYVGGLLGDRSPELARLGRVLFIGGVLLAAVPVAQAPVLVLTQAVGVQLGPLAAAAILFAPTLIALGAVAPIAVRLVTRDVSTAAARVGSVTAISTTGSFIATLATPYALIPMLETSTIIFSTAALLLAMSALLLMRSKCRSIVVGVVVLLPLTASQLVRATAPALPPGITIVAREQSPYGLVEVIEDSNRKVRLLRADRSIIGGQFMLTREPCFGFVQLLTNVAMLPKQGDALIIGLGAGSVPSALQARGFTTDVAEIDPAVARFAQSYFGFVPSGDMYVEDARTFVQRTHKRYNVIVQDTFTGGATPEHLLSLEYLSRLREALTHDGVLSLNFIGYGNGPYADAAQAVERTLRAVFPNVRAFQDEDPAGSEATNIVFFASASELSVAHGSAPRWEVLQHVPDGQIISDKLNPLGRLQLRSSAEHFDAMGLLLEPAVWAR